MSKMGLIGYDNILTDTTATLITSPGSAAGFPIENLATPMTTEIWKSTSTTTATIEVSFEEAATVDYIGLAAHSGLIGCDVTVSAKAFDEEVFTQIGTGEVTSRNAFLLQLDPTVFSASDVDQFTEVGAGETLTGNMTNVVAMGNNRMAVVRASGDESDYFIRMYSIDPFTGVATAVGAEYTVTGFVVPGALVKISETEFLSFGQALAFNKFTFDDGTETWSQSAEVAVQTGTTWAGAAPIDEDNALVVSYTGAGAAPRQIAQLRYDSGDDEWQEIGTPVNIGTSGLIRGFCTVAPGICAVVLDDELKTYSFEDGVFTLLDTTELQSNGAYIEPTGDSKIAILDIVTDDLYSAEWSGEWNISSVKTPTDYDGLSSIQPLASTTDNFIVLLVDDTDLAFYALDQLPNQIKVVIESPTAAVKSVGVMYLGEVLTMQRSIYGGHSPITLARETELIRNKTEGGQFSGNAFVSKGYKTEIAFENLTPDWYRTKFDPFVQAARTRPFFWKWNPQQYATECALCWTESDITPTNSGKGRLMDVSMKVIGYDY